MTILAVGCAPAPGNLPPASGAGGSSPPEKSRLESSAAARAGFTAAGLEAAGYILLAYQVQTGAGKPDLLARGVTLLSLADRAITETLSSALPRDQELYVTAAWNTWRQAQIRVLVSGEDRAGEYPHEYPQREVAEPIPKEALGFGEYMQLAWGETRSHIIATYLWNSTLSLRAVLDEACGREPTAMGEAVASSIAWQERLMRYLSETSAGGPLPVPDRHEPGRDGQARLRAAAIAAGVAAAALSEARRLGGTPEGAPFPRDGGGDCRSKPSGGTVFEAAVSSMAASLGANRSGVRPLQEDIASALRSIESGVPATGQAVPSGVQGTLITLVAKDAPAAFSGLQAAVADALGARQTPT